ncbi:MAG: hypothetical protein VX610_07260 [SAR324 cluster bacterium]|nr:hypothetical protein [SAR324 cluster bacterium]
MSRPKRDLRRVSLNLPKVLHRELVRNAHERGLTVTHVVVEILERHFWEELPARSEQIELFPEQPP